MSKTTPSVLLSAAPNGALAVPRGFPMSAVWALFWLTIRQHCRARRLFILGALFLLPAVIAIVARYLQTAPVRDVEFWLVFTILPQGLVPLSALLYASGMIQDEIEEQTLTYLLTRPLPKWTIYLAKFLATFVVTAVLASAFTLVTYLAIYVGLPDATFDTFLDRTGKTIALLTLALFAYCSVFGLLSLVVKRSLVVGVAYIVVFESVLANIDFAVRHLTIMYYFRVLASRWMHLKYDDWTLNLKEAPGSVECLLTLLAASLVFLVLGTLSFSTREFRLKTPEGS
jgi:ABC-2 type transport system permease protein